MIFRDQVRRRLEVFLIQQILEVAAVNPLLLRITFDPNVVLLNGDALAESLRVGHLKDPLKGQPRTLFADRGKSLRSRGRLTPRGRKRCDFILRTMTLLIKISQRQLSRSFI